MGTTVTQRWSSRVRRRRCSKNALQQCVHSSQTPPCRRFSRPCCTRWDSLSLLTRAASSALRAAPRCDGVLFLHPRFLTRWQLQKLLQPPPFMPNVEFCSFRGLPDMPGDPFWDASNTFHQIPPVCLVSMLMPLFLHRLQGIPHAGSENLITIQPRVCVCVCMQEL